MAFARVNRIVLHYQDSGEDSLPAIAFANALGTDFRIWDRVAGLLGGRFRLIRYDKRGHGLSDVPAAPYQMTDHVEDLASLLDLLGINRAIIAGVSVGGMIAQGLAALRPDLVRALVLLDTAHKLGTDDSWNTRIANVEKDGIGCVADGILKGWFTEPFRSGGNPDFEGYGNMLKGSPVEGYVGTCAAIRDCDLTESTRALSVPALCIAGDQDGSTPPDLVRSMANLITGSQFEIIKDAGHLPLIERPEKTAAMIAEFAAKHSRPV